MTGSSSLALHEVHEASTIIQKAAHENANIIFGAVMDEAMKESVKITVIAAGFREVNRKPLERPSYMPKTWKAEPEPQPRSRSRSPSPHVPCRRSSAAGAGNYSGIEYAAIWTYQLSFGVRRKRPESLARDSRRASRGSPFFL